MSQPVEPQVRQGLLLAAFGQELARLNDNRVYLLALIAQQAERIAELEVGGPPPDVDVEPVQP